MKELKVFDFNGKNVIDSRLVAEMIGMQHKELLRKIRGYDEILLSAKLRSVDFFISSTYKDSTGRELPCYLLTKQGCEMIANKLTGEKGVLFTARYVEAFNKMEEVLNDQPAISEFKKQEIETKHMNAKTRMASLWLKMADRVSFNKEYTMICESYASQVLAGERVLPLPECKEKYYSAGEVGNMLGVSANTIGRIANRNSLKTENNGKYFFDKSAYSNKEVQTFKYNLHGIEELRKILEKSVI